MGSQLPKFCTETRNRDLTPAHTVWCNNSWHIDGYCESLHSVRSAIQVSAHVPVSLIEIRRALGIRGTWKCKKVLRVPTWRPAPSAAGPCHISKPKSYHVRLFFSLSIIHIMSLLKYIMLLLCHLFVLQFWTIISYYFKFSKTAIISLMSILLFQLFFLALIISIISINTLLWHLVLITCIMSLISFDMLYIN